MSSLSQFAPFAGGGLKSYQTGYLNTGNSASSSSGAGEDNSYVNITVSSVSTAKTICSFDGSFGFYDSYYVTNSAAMTDKPFSNAYPGAVGIATARLTSATNLRIACGMNQGGSTVRGRWQLAEAN